MSAPPPAAPGDRGSEYLPDFCQARVVLTVVLVAALLAVVLALAGPPSRTGFFVTLARTSGYLLWNGLLCAAVLCRARPWLARRSLRASSLISLALVVGTVALVSEAAFWLGQAWDARIGAHSGLFPRDHWRFLLPNAAIAAIVGALALRYFYVAHEWRRSVELEARSRLRALFLLRNLSVGAIAGGLALRYFYVSQQWKRNVEAEASARVRALQARIRPHFLFNSMNTIAALTRSDPGRAEEAVEDLADLFRVSLSEARAQITLQEELEVARTYQRIEQLRLGARLRVDWRVADLPPQALVPSLLLQPLLENAVGHGVEPLPGGGVVTIEGRIDGGDVVVEVSNPVDAAARPARTGHRMALDNVRERLDLAFPGRASMDVDERGDRYRVRIRFPLVLGAAGAPHESA
jgi:two-component system, LytTR family, sensor histidine kinase AlgZ